MYLKRALSQFNHLSLGERWAMGQKWSLQIFLNWKKCTRRKRRKTDTKNRASLYFCTAKVCCVYCSVFHKNKPLWVKVSFVHRGAFSRQMRHPEPPKYFCSQYFPTSLKYLPVSATVRWVCLPSFCTPGASNRRRVIGSEELMTARAHSSSGAHF